MSLCNLFARGCLVVFTMLHVPQPQDADVDASDVNKERQRGILIRKKDKKKKKKEEEAVKREPLMLELDAIFKALEASSATGKLCLVLDLEAV